MSRRKTKRKAEDDPPRESALSMYISKRPRCGTGAVPGTMRWGKSAASPAAMRRPDEIKAGDLFYVNMALFDNTNKETNHTRAGPSERKRPPHPNQVAGVDDAAPSSQSKPFVPAVVFAIESELFCVEGAEPTCRVRSSGAMYHVMEEEIRHLGYNVHKYLTIVRIVSISRLGSKSGDRTSPSTTESHDTDPSTEDDDGENDKASFSEDKEGSKDARPSGGLRIAKRRSDRNGSYTSKSHSVTFQIVRTPCRSLSKYVESRRVFNSPYDVVTEMYTLASSVGCTGHRNGAPFLHYISPVQCETVPDCSTANKDVYQPLSKLWGSLRESKIDPMSPVTQRVPLLLCDRGIFISKLKDIANVGKDPMRILLWAVTPADDPESGLRGFLPTDQVMPLPVGTFFDGVETLYFSNGSVHTDVLSRRVTKGWASTYPNGFKIGSRGTVWVPNVHDFGSMPNYIVFEQRKSHARICEDIASKTEDVLERRASSLSDHRVSVSRCASNDPVVAGDADSHPQPPATAKQSVHEPVQDYDTETSSGSSSGSDSDSDSES